MPNAEKGGHFETKTALGNGYPCPDCVGTMLPGVTYSFPAPPATRGTGKKYYPYSGTAVTWGTMPGSTLGDCYRCKGTGLVDERRTRPERRARSDRRG